MTGPGVQGMTWAKAPAATCMVELDTGTLYCLHSQTPPFLHPPGEWAGGLGGGRVCCDLSATPCHLLDPLHKLQGTEDKLVTQLSW